eukprot:2437073-Pyramimonas_sp.AAC.1
MDKSGPLLQEFNPALYDLGVHSLTTYVNQLASLDEASRELKMNKILVRLRPCRRAPSASA